MFPILLLLAQISGISCPGPDISCPVAGDGDVHPSCLQVYHENTGFYGISDMIYNLAEYGKKSVDDMILQQLCRLPLSGGSFLPECYFWRTCGDDSHDTKSDEKTFFQRLLPFIKDVEQTFNKSTQYKYHCPVQEYIGILEDLPYIYIYDEGLEIRRPHHIMFDWLPYREINRILTKLLKSLNTNVEAEKRLIREAVDTVFGSSNVNIYQLFQLHLQNPSKDSKLMLKLVLAKYISKYLTANRVSCVLQQLKRNKFLDCNFGPGRELFNIQNRAVEKIIETTNDVIEKHGPLPYIDLAHYFVEELDHLDIHEIITTQYRNFLTIQNWVKTIDWNDEFERIANATLPLMDVFKALICVNDGHLGSSEIMKQFFQKIHSASSNEGLDYAVKDILHIFPYILNRYRFEYLGGQDIASLDGYDYDKWVWPFHITTYIKNNRGALGKLLNFEIQSSDVERAIGEAVYDIHTKVENFFYNNVYTQFIKLFGGISLTAQEKEIIQEPIQEFGQFMMCLYCKIVSKCHNKEPFCESCSH